MAEVIAFPQRVETKTLHFDEKNSFGEIGGLMLSLVLHQPSVDAGAVDPAAAGRLRHRMPLSHQQQRFEAAVHPRLTGVSKCCGKPLAIRLVEPRLGRVIMSLHAPQGTPASLALQVLWRPT